MIEEMMMHENRNNSLKSKQILLSLKSGDEVKMLDAVSQLSTELSMAQEEQLASFQLDLLIPELLNCLKKEEIPDIMCNESAFQIIDFL